MSVATIKFWGVRGSLARPSPKTNCYGGNTPCIEIRYAKDLLICDAGTGLYELGHELTKNKSKIVGTILFSHYHWDHIIGLPFFTPIYNKRNRFTIIGRTGLKKALTALLSPPNFPVKLSDFGAKIKFKPKKAGKFKIGDISIEAFDVNHPNGAFGYKFTFPNKKSAVFISDNGPMRNDTNLINKIGGADILIHDAQYLPEEYLKRKRFGHSTYHYVLDLARKARAKTVVLFHHDPSRTDGQMKAIESAAKKLAKRIGLKAKVLAAREKMILKL